MKKYNKYNKIEDKREIISPYFQQKEKQNSNFISNIIYSTSHPLNLREGAGYEYNVITIIPKNQQVIYNGKHIDNWYFVKYKDFQGFCLKDYLILN